MTRLARSFWTLAVMLPMAGTLAAQQSPAPGDSAELSLSEAVRRALGESEEVLLARSQVNLAGAQVASARSAVYPQVSASFGYTRTLASVFQSSGSTPAVPDSQQFNPDPNAPLEDRVAYLEDRVPFAAMGSLGGLFGDLPFGRDHVYNASINGSQLLYSGGRAGAAMAIARNYRAAAEAGLSQEEAQIQLRVRSAYYQALLAQEVAAIAQAAYDQAEAFYQQELLRLQAGQAAELETMRAEVDRDNLAPQVIEGRNAADLAMLNLKRLVNLPISQPIRLSTQLTVPDLADSAAVRPSQELVDAQRASLTALEEQVQIRQQQVRIARGAFLPNVSLSTAYGRQLYPTDPFTFTDPWRTDWTVAVQVSVPVFTGWKRTADLSTARVELERSRLQLIQLREATELQYEQAAREKQRALASMQARQRTVEIAQRVYDLTVLRYDRGLATQLEVSDSRLGLLQARTNLAQAISDFHTSDAGVVGAAAPNVSTAAAGQAAQQSSAATTTGTTTGVPQ